MLIVLSSVSNCFAQVLSVKRKNHASAVTPAGPGVLRVRGRDVQRLDLQSLNLDSPGDPSKKHMGPPPTAQACAGSAAETASRESPRSTVWKTQGETGPHRMPPCRRP